MAWEIAEQLLYCLLFNKKTQKTNLKSLSCTENMHVFNSNNRLINNGVYEN